MGEIKKAFLSTTSWVVWLTALLTATLMGLQYYDRGGIVLPHDIMAQIFSIVAGAYTGFDRLAFFIKSRSLDFGEADFGDTSKLKAIVFICLLLLIEAVVLQVFFQVPGMAITDILYGYGAAAGAYAIGNKAIESAKHAGPKQAPPKNP